MDEWGKNIIDELHDVNDIDTYAAVVEQTFWKRPPREKWKDKKNGDEDNIKKDNMLDEDDYKKDNILYQNGDDEDNKKDHPSRFRL